MEPHPVLEAYYESGARKGEFLHRTFDRTAPHYERINRIGSFGLGLRYRRQALERAGLTAGMRMIDVASGTGLVARAALLLHGSLDVTCVEPSGGMAAEGRKLHRAPLVRAVAEKLPFAGGQFDFLSMGYALRHVGDLPGAFSELRRVLRPGGRLLVLEVSKPAGRIAQAITRLSMGRILPRLCGVLTGSREVRTLMEYYWETIEHCVPPARILEAMAAGGLEDPQRRLVHGVFSEYTARRPLSG